MHEFFGDILVSILLSSIMYLTFEAPVIIAERYFFEHAAEKEVFDLRAT